MLLERVCMQLAVKFALHEEQLRERQREAEAAGNPGVIPLADAIYALSLIVGVLVFLHVYDAWRRVNWAQWWAETRASEGARESAPGAAPRSPAGSRVPSGARRLPPESRRHAARRFSPPPGARRSDS